MRRPESQELRSPSTRSASVASLVRSLTESRVQPKPKPKPMEQRVLDVATDYFLKYGYDGTSINAMARNSGISKESIYCYFRSKKQLLEGVIDRELAEYHRRLDALDARLYTMKLRDALICVAETSLTLVTTDRTLALRRLIFDEATRSPDVGRRYYKIGAGRVNVVLEKVFKTHAYVSEFDVPALSQHFAALMSWRTTLERQCAVQPQPTAPEITEGAREIVDDFMKAFLRQK
jgi:TetR/AcrR family transcriptional repressor of mexJK operon